MIKRLEVVLSTRNTISLLEALSMYSLSKFRVYKNLNEFIIVRNLTTEEYMLVHTATHEVYRTLTATSNENCIRRLMILDYDVDVVFDEEE